MPQVQRTELAFEGPPPDAGGLSRRWRVLLGEAAEIISLLPPEEAGTCVLESDGALCRATPEELRLPGTVERLRFRPGSIRGVLPQIGAS